jgi:putative membrane protein
MSAAVSNDKAYIKLITVVSVIIPIAVAILLFMPVRVFDESGWVKMLPHINAIINSMTAVLLISAVVMVRQGNIEMHKKLMSSAFVLGSLFLISYIIYHATIDSTVFGDINGDGIVSDDELAEVGMLRRVYLFVLLSHILLSIVVVPFVLFAFYYSLTDKIEKHKKVVKFTFPIWLYVSITGVIAYLFISPYYQ